MQRIVIGIVAMILPFAVVGVGYALRLETADITITTDGCDVTEYTLPANQPPHIRIVNRAEEPMVLTLPDLGDSITVAPSQYAVMPLQPYVWGTFSFFCLSDSVHTVLKGSTSNTFVCGLDRYAIQPYALSRGALIIEKHDRLRSLDSSTPKARP